MLIDGSIDAETYNTRKQKLALSIEALKDEIRNRPDPEQTERDRITYLELMKCLAALHIQAKAPEKREIVENAFSNRKIIGNNVELEPNEWLRTSDTGSLVLAGPLYRNTSRTANAAEDGDRDTKSLRALIDVYQRVLGIEAAENEVEVCNFERRSRQATASKACNANTSGVFKRWDLFANDLAFQQLFTADEADQLAKKIAAFRPSSA